jgi:hypothetical protein
VYHRENLQVESQQCIIVDMSFHNPLLREQDQKNILIIFYKSHLSETL